VGKENCHSFGYQHSLKPSERDGELGCFAKLKFRNWKQSKFVFREKVSFTYSVFVFLELNKMKGFLRGKQFQFNLAV